jgi:hypothetical protein
VRNSFSLSGFREQALVEVGLVRLWEELVPACGGLAGTAPSCGDEELGGALVDLALSGVRSVRHLSEQSALIDDVRHG